MVYNGDTIERLLLEFSAPARFKYWKFWSPKVSYGAVVCLKLRNLFQCSLEKKLIKIIILCYTGSKNFKLDVQAC